MNELSIVRQNGCAYIDSREVADCIGKSHKDMLRDIRGYVSIIESSNGRSFAPVDFFVESDYADSRGRVKPRYLLSKLGCELCASKLVGKKGVLFTAAYVSRFNELEAAERAEVGALAAMPAPRLGEYNAYARIIMRGLKWIGATPGQIMRFLKNTYEPLGINVGDGADLGDDADACSGEPAQRWYRAGEIAEGLGINSLHGKPHAQAVACILSENIFIGAAHMRVETEAFGGCTNIRVLYDIDALRAVIRWLIDNDWPEEVHGFARTYYVQYAAD